MSGRGRKTYTSVSEMVRDITGDNDLADEIERHSVTNSRQPLIGRLIRSIFKAVHNIFRSR